MDRSRLSWILERRAVAKRVVTGKELDDITKMLCKSPQPDYEGIASKMKLSVNYIKRMHTVVKKNAKQQGIPTESGICRPQVKKRAYSPQR